MSALRIHVKMVELVSILYPGTPVFVIVGGLATTATWTSTIVCLRRVLTEVRARIAQHRMFAHV